MAIRIVPCGQDFKKVIKGVEFSLHRLSEEEDLALKNEHTQRGVLDYQTYSRAVLRKIVRGWGEGITTHEGQAFPFSPDNVWSLPDSVRADIVESNNEGRPTNEPESSSNSGSSGG